jgi:AcrR family transcriptional regulator
VPDRPFHHGNLRAALLSGAVETVREQGVEALSLRDLARRVGVSHAAPRRHFPDRQALLDALAEHGFRSLAAAVAEADGTAGRPAERFRAVAAAFVGFAAEQPALMELMFTRKSADQNPDVAQAAGEFFAAVDEVMRDALRTGPPLPVDAARRELLVIAALNGIATLAAAGRVGADRVPELIDDLTTVFALAD